ncbi:ABC transporter ATP-binding protein [Bifidobacterium sp. 82T10]|uniref:ABC transporter ATP-binding protein n=1 Tax=Bifidobacterium miconis TaxID=2834435 RepID=A0ABS6WCJ5_9BIFI|nr:ABC transporter ATP-binding protein [Bifidobacterium miconis]MBW3091435.1 ABC transporter ATP-binding protein [Bifidobacterium miconis]
MPVLDIRSLTREFNRRDKPFAAVDHVGLSVDAGEFVAIVGRSGNGKTTLLNLITGLLRPTSGTVSVDGLDVASLDDRTASAMRNRTIGFVTQSATLLGNLTVLDNVILPAVMAGDDRDAASGNGDVATVPAAPADPDMPDVIAPEQHEAGDDPLVRRARALLASLQVDDLAGCYPKELSGGEMRRVSIARALMNRPKLLIADEPTGDLDADSTAVVMRLLRSTADDGTAVLMVTHDPDALAYVDRTLRMDRGRLAAA